MTEKELKHLSRAELLEMLLAQAEENRKLKKPAAGGAGCPFRPPDCHFPGRSLAEGALQLNGVFEAADRAARQYLENVQRLAWEGRAAP